MTSQASVDFVRSHRLEDVRQLAFLGDKYPEVDMPWALDQIRGGQMARTKLPSWAARDGIVYPPHLSMEQCSSETTARYKQRVIAEWLKKIAEQLKKDGFNGQKTSLTDLTGGFGVDFSFLAPLFDEATYVERLPHLCEVARHNLALLGLDMAHVEHEDGIAYLEKMPPSTVIYLDPARRDAQGRKTYSIKDCTPDVALLCTRLLAKCRLLVIKLSPMLDWHEAVRELQCVCEVHIVSTANECKELLLVCAREEQPLRVVCVNDGQEFAFEVGGSREAQSSLSPRSNPSAQITQSTQPPKGVTLLLPNASIQKAGCFAELCEAFSLASISPNSHLFLPTENSDESVLFERFPGRAFRILDVCTLNKKALKGALAGIDRASVAVRNFPLTAEQLRKRLKLKDGGDVYVFGTTTLAREHIIIITKKLR